MAATAEDLRLELQDKREAVSRDLEELGDKVSPKRAADRAAGKVRRAAHNAKEKVMGSTGEIGDTASDAAGRAGDKLADMKDTVADTPEVIRQRTEGNPIAAGLVAFGLGALAASMIPPTRREQHLVAQFEGELQGVAADLGDAAAAVKDDLQQNNQDVVADLREHAAEATQQVKAAAGDAVGDVKADAIDSARDVTSGTEPAISQPPQSARSPFPPT